MLFNADHHILVTGASSGIGKAIAQLCNSQGATVIANGRSIDRLCEAQNEAPYPNLWYNEVHDLLSNINELEMWIRFLRERYGKLWGFAHCAGQGCMDTLRTCSIAQLQKLFNINVYAPLLLAKGFADRRNSISGGAMLFISSASAIYPETGHLSYSASKAALAAAMACISRELNGRIRVHCVAPGLVQTPMTLKDDAEMGGVYLAEQAKRYSLGLGSPEDIAELSVFLLSEKAKWLTGQNYVMGGGCY